MSSPKYKRILLKLSGEVLMGKQPYGIDLDTVSRLADEVLAVAATGVQLALVIGGGNIFRGLAGGQHSGRRSSIVTRFSRAPASTASIPPIPRPIRLPTASTGSPSTKSWPRTCASWTLPPLPLRGTTGFR